MASEQENRESFRIQAFYCAENGSPITARIAAALADGLTRDAAVGARVLDWPGEPTRDALPLRLIGGLHALVLSGRDEALAAAFRGEVDEAAVARVLAGALVRHDAALLPWLDGPPQTNEPGRSAALMAGLLEVARAIGPRLELLEIGSSAGLNLLIDRYRIDLGWMTVGPRDSPVTIVPEWRGAPPAPTTVEIVSVRGCDVAPLDATEPTVEARLAAYVWADEPARAARMRAGVAMMRTRGVDLVRADAADWIGARLGEPLADGVGRVLMHSVVWQYLPDATADRVRAAMLAAGERATVARPLAWVTMEPDRAIGHQVIRVRTWPGGDWRIVGTAQAHGRWIAPGMPEGGGGIALPDAARVRPA